MTAPPPRKGNFLTKYITDNRQRTTDNGQQTRLRVSESSTMLARIAEWKQSRPKVNRQRRVLMHFFVKKLLKNS